MQTENYYTNFKLFLPKKNLLKDKIIITKHDSVTRSIIDPKIIATNCNNSINESNNNFYLNHWQPIISNELKRENFITATTLRPKTELQKTKYFFKGNYEWLLITLLLILIILTWVKISYKNAIEQTFISTINQQSARKLISEKSNLIQKASTFLSVTYVFTTSIFIFELLNYYNFNVFAINGFNLFFICLISVALFFVFKNLLYWLSGVLFYSEVHIQEFLSNGNIFYRTIGVIILPIVFGIPYVSNYVAQTLIYIGISVFALSFILRIIRGFILSFQNKLSLFYSFLYFCVLEILPFLYVYYYVKILW